MSLLWKVCGIALIAAAAAMFFGKDKQWTVILAAALLIFGQTVVQLWQFADFFREQSGVLTLSSQGKEAVAVLWKGLGIGVLCAGAAAALREMQAGTLADAMELYGKVQILLLCLPYLEKLLRMAAELLSFSLS